MWAANPTEVPNDVWMYTLKPARLAMLTEGPTDAEKALAAKHWMYSVELLKKGIVIFGGRTVDRTDASHATMVFRAASEAEARAVMDGDPAVQGGLFKAQLFRYQPMLVGAWAPPA